MWLIRFTLTPIIALHGITNPDKKCRITGISRCKTLYFSHELPSACFSRRTNQDGEILYFTRSILIPCPYDRTNLIQSIIILRVFLLFLRINCVKLHVVFVLANLSISTILLPIIFIYLIIYQCKVSCPPRPITAAYISPFSILNGKYTVRMKYCVLTDSLPHITDYILFLNIP